MQTSGCWRNSSRDHRDTDSNRYCQCVTWNLMKWMGHPTTSSVFSAMRIRYFHPIHCLHAFWCDLHWSGPKPAQNMHWSYWSVIHVTQMLSIRCNTFLTGDTLIRWYCVSVHLRFFSSSPYTYSSEVLTCPNTWRWDSHEIGKGSRDSYHKQASLDVSGARGVLRSALDLHSKI